MVRCEPASNFTGLTDTREDVTRGIFALSRKDGTGLFSSLTSADLRRFAVQAVAMADHIDGLNK
jgi:hypothetical protein